MRRRYRSFLWPVVLILVGVFAILVDLNVISADRLYRLGDLWPLILIVIGLELLARRTLKGVAVDVAAALILLIAVVGTVAYVSVGPAIPGGTQRLDMSGEVGTLTTADLHVDVGAANITVEGNGSLGPDLYRAHIEYSGAKPSVDLDKSTGDLRISQEGGDFLFLGNRRFVLDLEINPAVTWSIELNSGAATDTFRLTEVKVGSINLNTGAAHDDITLGPPSGMVPISVNGGVLTVDVHRPSGTEASARVSAGIANLTADGERAGGIGTKDWQSAGYDSAADSYSIDVSGGVCNVIVDTGGPSG